MIINGIMKTRVQFTRALRAVGNLAREPFALAQPTGRDIARMDFGANIQCDTNVMFNGTSHFQPSCARAVERARKETFGLRWDKDPRNVIRGIGSHSDMSYGCLEWNGSDRNEFRNTPQIALPKAKDTRHASHARARSRVSRGIGSCSCRRRQQEWEGTMTHHFNHCQLMTRSN
jgi:hypothetical protein